LNTNPLENKSSTLMIILTLLFYLGAKGQINFSRSKAESLAILMKKEPKITCLTSSSISFFTIELKVADTTITMNYFLMDTTDIAGDEMLKQCNIDRNYMHEILTLFQNLKVNKLRIYESHYYFRPTDKTEIETGYLFVLSGQPPKIRSRENGQKRLKSLEKVKGSETWFKYVCTT